MNDGSCAPRDGGIDAGPSSTNGTFGRGGATCSGGASAVRSAGAIAGSGMGGCAAGGCGGHRRVRARRAADGAGESHRIRAQRRPPRRATRNYRAVERLDHLRRALPAHRRILFDGDGNRVAERIGHVVSQVADVRQLLVPLAVEYRVKAFTFPRTMTGQHLPRDETQAVDVAARVERRALDLFRRHVRGRSDRHAGHGELRVAGHRAREPEVRQQRPVLWVDEDVFRLHVAVNDAHRVRRPERARDVAREPLGAVRSRDDRIRESAP